MIFRRQLYDYDCAITAIYNLFVFFQKKIPLDNPIEKDFPTGAEGDINFQLIIDKLKGYFTFDEVLTFNPNNIFDKVKSGRVILVQKFDFSLNHHVELLIPSKLPNCITIVNSMDSDNILQDYTRWQFFKTRFLRCFLGLVINV